MTTKHPSETSGRVFDEVKRERHALLDPVEQQDYLRAREEAELRMSLAELVYEARIRAGLNQTELAELAHTRQSVISAIENGAQMPQISTLMRIAEAVNTPLELRIGESSFVMNRAAS